MNDDIFEQARGLIGPGVIEHFLSCPGAYWKAGEYWALNPARGDSSIGSFSISETGAWYDFSGGEGGDLIDLLVAWRGGSALEAAEEIIRAAGQVPERKERPHRAPVKASAEKKVGARIPAPEDALKSLNRAISEPWVLNPKKGKPRGAAAKGWTYRTREGGVAFCVVRYEINGEKTDVLPWYYGADEKWHNGQAMSNGRPLYKLDLLAKADKSTRILVVEGEKCPT